MSDIDEQECVDCMGTGEIQAINLGADSHGENLPCPTCMSVEHDDTIRQLQSDLSASLAANASEFKRGQEVMRDRAKKIYATR
jgi:hypothetical protein